MATARKAVGINNVPLEKNKKKLILRYFHGTMPRERRIWRRLFGFYSKKKKKQTEIQWEDPDFWKPNPIQLLFGVGFFAIQRNIGGMSLIETQVEIVVYGTQS